MVAIKTNKNFKSRKRNKKTRKVYGNKKKTKGGVAPIQTSVTPLQPITSEESLTPSIVPITSEESPTQPNAISELPITLEESPTTLKRIKKRLMNLDVYITPATGTKKRKVEFDVRTFHDFYDYLNEVDKFLKNTLEEELIALTNPEHKVTDPIKKPYEFYYQEQGEKDDK
jgi:hypothetical protein